MTAEVAQVARCGAEQFVSRALTYISSHECSVPRAVADLWNGAHLSRSALDELARSGAIGRVNDALSHQRFAIASACGEEGGVPVRNLLSASPAESHTVTVRYRSLEVQYAAADGCVRPVRKFLLRDVDFVLGNLAAEIEGKRLVREWFAKIRSALVRHHAARVDQLPAAVKAAIDRAAPDGSDSEEIADAA